MFRPRTIGRAGHRSPEHKLHVCMILLASSWPFTKKIIITIIKNSFCSSLSMQHLRTYPRTINAWITTRRRDPCICTHAGAGRITSRGGGSVYLQAQHHPPEHIVALRARKSGVVKLAAHGKQLARGLLRFPPGANKPFLQGRQSTPPKPGAHTAQQERKQGRVRRECMCEHIMKCK